MQKVLLLAVFTGFTSSVLYAQFSLRAEFGQLYDHQQGVNQIGPVGIISDNGDAAWTVYGLVPGYAFNPRWGMDMRLRYFKTVSGYGVADLEEDYEPFGPIEKGSALGYPTFNVQPVVRFQLVKLGPVDLRIHAGPSLVFQFADQGGQVFDYQGRHPNTAYVQNQLDDANRPFYVGLTYGGSVNYRRFFFTVDYHDNLNNSFTEDLVFEEQSYSFYNAMKYLTLSLGYQLLGKPKEQSKNIE